jgi:hypothetical protein
MAILSTLFERGNSRFRSFDFNPNFFGFFVLVAGLVDLN